MHFGSVIYPDIDTASIERIRRRYDPTAAFIAPHVTVVFPVPERVGKGRCRRALRESREAGLEAAWRVSELHMVALPDEVVAWATGRRAEFPAGCRVVEMGSVPLGRRKGGGGVARV